MNRKEMIEKLKENMPDFQGSEEEAEIKKALYIYVELGKLKSFDERYYFGNSQTKRKIYQLAQSQKNRIDEIARERKIICVSLTYLYCSILREFGIEAHASVVDKEDEHMKPIIKTKSGKTFVADLQQDLENIQTRSRLEHFEYRDKEREESTLQSSQDVITEMLIEMGYINREEDYKNGEIERLQEEVKNQNPHQALQTVLEDELLYRGNEDMESIEVSKFYRGIFRKVMPHYLERKIFVFHCYREQEEKQRDYTLCVFSEEDTIKPYLFSKRDRRFLRIEIQKIRELEEDGLKLGARQKENGVSKLRKYMKKQLEGKREEEYK